MRIDDVPIPGAKVIYPGSFTDARGLFKETYARSRYASAGISDTFIQDNVSLSKGLVLRGLHADPRMAKLVQVLHGSAFDVLVDLRRDSPTFLRWHAVTLRAHEHTQLYIPAGCLHGFLALEDQTLLAYKQSAEYDPATEFGVAWNDSDLGIEWPLGGASPLLSPKDAANPTLRDLGYL